MMRNGEQCTFAGVIVASAAFWFAIFFAINLASGASEGTFNNVDPDFITIGAGGFDVNDNE
ncbi:MAG: hypothetical protein VCB60_03615, partial [Alphaproteobacteria bacterium]